MPSICAPQPYEINGSCGEVEKAVKEVRNKKSKGIMMYLQMYSNCWEKMVSNNDTTDEQHI